MTLLPRKLSTRLILSFLVIVMIVGLTAGFVHMKTQETQILDAMILGADQLSGSIVGATWHAMRADQRSAAYEIMQAIATKQGINRIRIFNKEGRVMFSTVANDSGTVDKDAESCSMCHATNRPLLRLDASSRARTFRAADGRRTLGMVTPIYNELACSNADCHAHPASMSVLGVVDVSLDLSVVDQEIAAVRTRVMLISGGMFLLVAAFMIAFTKRYVDTPIRRLIASAHSVSVMQLDEPVVVSSSDELGELARSFDNMRLRLKEAISELNAFSQNLETKVEERTEQLRAAQKKLLQSDRLASLGQLSASVAHEINNPLSGVLNLAMLLQRILKDDGIPPGRIKESREYLGSIVRETSRVGRIVQDLLAFSRRSKSHQRADANFNAIVTTTINLISHKLKLMDVAVDLQLDPHLPAFNCDGSQMQQVLINLIMNGAEAAQGRPSGAVTVRTGSDGHGADLVLEVRDNGVGISPENIARLFTPFFTTKGEGKGVGLGLAVVYGIVQAHDGDIEVQSKVGEGTTFTVTIPFRGRDTAVAAPETSQGHPA